VIPVGPGIWVGPAGIEPLVPGHKERADSLRALFGFISRMVGTARGKNEDDVVRLRHYTSIGRLNSIMNENKLRAFDQGRVFAVPADSRITKKSPRDVEIALGIPRGSANAYVDFDTKPGEFSPSVNSLTGSTEWTHEGDFDLTERYPDFRKNRQ